MQTRHLRIKDCDAKKREKLQKKRKMQQEINKKTPVKITYAKTSKETRVRGSSFSDRAAAAATPRRGRRGRGSRRVVVGGDDVQIGTMTATTIKKSTFVMMAASDLADDPFVGDTRSAKKEIDNIVAAVEDTDMADYDADETEDEDDDDGDDNDEDDEMEEEDAEEYEYDSDETEIEMDMDIDVECEMEQEDMLPVDFGVCWKCGGLKGTYALQEKYCL